MAEKILLEVELDENDALSKATKLGLAIDDLKNKQKELDKTTEEGRKQYEAIGGEIASLQKEYRSYKSILEANNTALNSQIGSYDQLLAQLRSAEIELKKQGALLNADEKGMVKFSEAYFQASERVDNLKKGILLFNAGISQGSTNVGNYGNTLDSLRARLGALQQAYSVLNKEVDGEMFYKVEQEISSTSEKVRELEFELAKAQGKINEFGEREPRNPAKKAYDDALQSAQALTSGIALLSVVQADNENVAELQAKALKALVIAETTANIVRSKGEIIDTAANIQKAIYNKLVVAQTFVTQGATVATQALRAAMLTLGIGALIGLVAGLVTIFRKLASGTREVEKEFGDAKLSIDEYNKVMSETNHSVTEHTTKLNAYLKVARDTSRSDKERGAAIAELNKLMPELNGHLSTQNINTEAVNKAIEEHIRLITLQAKADALYNVILEKEQKFIENRTAAQDEFNKSQKQSQAFLETRVREKDKQRALNVILDEKAEFEEKAARATEKHEAAMKALSAEYEKLVAAIITGNGKTEDIDPTAALRDQEARLQLELMDANKSIEEQIDLNLKLIDVETAQSLLNKNLTEGEIALIKAKAAEEKKYYLERKKQLSEQPLAVIDFSIPKVEKLKIESQASLKEVGGYYDAIRKLQLDGINAETQAERDKLNVAADSVRAKIKLDTSLSDEKKKLLDKQLTDLQAYLDAENDADAEAHQAKMDRLQEYFDYTANVSQRLANIFQTALNNELIALDNQLKQKQISQEEYDSEVRKARTRDAKAQKAINLFQSVIDTASAVVEALPNIPLSVIIGLLGAAQTSFIASQPIPVFEQGGRIQKAEEGLRVRIGGKSHSEGGTKFYGTDGTVFEAQSGEDLFVLKREATAYIDMLSRVNQMHGGRPFSASPASFMEDGGYVARAGGGSMDNAEQMVAAMMRNFPDIFVSVKEFNRVQKAANAAKRVTVI